jgi:hypothetical protein
MNKYFMITAVMVIAWAGPVRAADYDICSGTLRPELTIKRCVIPAKLRARVLAVCKIGQSCTIIGVTRQDDDASIISTLVTVLRGKVPTRDDGIWYD